jgi:hypothetical protein
MSVRINVALPDETGRSNLAEQLKAGYLAHASRDMEIAGEWLPLEEEARQSPNAKEPGTDELVCPLAGYPTGTCSTISIPKPSRATIRRG